MTDLDTVLSLYSTDSSRLTAQLQYLLIIRGWAVSLYSLLLASSILIEIRLMAAIDLIIIPVFFALEIVYDSYRVLFYQRVMVYEKWLSTHANLPEEINNVLSGEKFLDMESTLKAGRNYAARNPVRISLYVILTTIIVVYLLA